MCSRNVLSLKEKWYLQEEKLKFFKLHTILPLIMYPPKVPHSEKYFLWKSTLYTIQRLSLKLKKKTQFAKLKNLLYNYYSTNITVFDFLDFIHFIIYYYSFCFKSKSLFQNHTLKKRNPNPFWYHLSFSYDYWKNDRDLWVSVLFLSLLKIIVQWKREFQKNLKKYTY